MGYYLIQPVGPVLHTELARQYVQIVVDQGKDLGCLEWNDAERPFDPTTLRLALRTGIACAAGIAVNATDIVPLDELIRVATSIPSAQTSSPHDDLMEAVAPGWNADTLRILEKGREFMVEDFARVREEFAEALAVTPKADLIDHWQALGGVLPQPL